MTRDVHGPRTLAALVACAAAAGCGDGAADQAGSASAAASLAASGGRMLEAADNQASASTSSSARPANQAIVAIAAGKLIAGSTPGDRGRDPTLEPALAEVELGAFDIDRAWYPNEPGRPPLRGVTRDKAAGLCKERGRRLCTELEWERACKGPDDSLFAGRAAWDASCSKDPASCASGFGVVGMGAYREWTASAVKAVADVKEGAAVRGAAPTASDLDRRCAHRASAPGNTESDDLAFRCCGGAANEAAIEPPAKRPVFERAQLTPQELDEMFASIPQLSKLARGILYFDPEAAPRDVTSRADAGDPKGYELVTHPLSWRPVVGEDLVIVAGLAGEDSFIVALHLLPDGRHRVASSLVLRKDRGPVVLAFDRSVDSRLEWSTCWQCPGESGRITYRDDRRVIITQE